MTAFGLAALGVVNAPPAVAQESSPAAEDAWQLAGAVYLWGADVGGTTFRGTVIDVSFSDVVDNLQMGFLGSFAARKGKWSILTDVVYLDVGANKGTAVSIPIGPGSIDVSADARLDMKALALHFLGGYTVATDGKSRLDVVAGARYLDLKTDLGLTFTVGERSRSADFSTDGSVWDAIVGAQGSIALGEKWHIPYHVDIGTGQSDFTWQALGGVRFRAAKWLDLAAVYRHASWNLKSDGLLEDLNLSGPAGGLIFRF